MQTAAMSRKRTNKASLEVDQTATSPAGHYFHAVDKMMESAEPLDGSEQESLIREFEEIQLRSARTWPVRMFTLHCRLDHCLTAFCLQNADMVVPCKRSCCNSVTSYARFVFSSSLPGLRVHKTAFAFPFERSDFGWQFLTHSSSLCFCRECLGVERLLWQFASWCLLGGSIACHGTWYVSKG